jgi:hypothetical protein
MRIQPADSGAIARVRLDDAQGVQVTAVGSPVNVWSKDGVLVARVLPEASMSFVPQAVASNSFSSAGCVVKKSDTAFLADAAGNQLFELRAGKNVDLNKFIGTRAKVSGTIESPRKSEAGVAQVVNVSAVEIAAGASCSDVAARMGAAAGAAGFASASSDAPTGATAGAPKAGMSGGLIAGIVIVGTTGVVVGSLAAAGQFSSTSP